MVVLVPLPRANHRDHCALGWENSSLNTNLQHLEYFRCMEAIIEDEELGKIMINVEKGNIFSGLLGWGVGEKFR